MARLPWIMATTARNPGARRAARGPTRGPGGGTPPRWRVGLGIVAVAAVACSERARPAASEADPVDAAARARGHAVIGELKRTLVGALTKALADGPAQAIAVCQTEAPAIAARLSHDGIVVGRATRKPRDPANAVGGWQAEALTSFEQARAAGPLDGKSFVARLADGRVGYAEPLVIQEVCLACHGAAVAPEVRAALDARYPTDRATGYQLGELRGLAWVELPAGAAR